MKNLIKQLLRESLMETKSYKLLTEKRNRVNLNKLFLMLEREIKVGDNLIKKLNSIDTPLSKKLLAFFNSDKIKDDANAEYVDYDRKNEKLITLGYKDRDGNTRERLFKINKLLNYLGSDIKDIKDYEIEDLIGHLKQADTSQLKMVDGEDILKAYHCENYENDETMGSCMRYDYAQEYLKIYTNNPDSVKCLVLLNPETNKVRGRALIWHMDNDQYFMDRVYTTNKEYNTYFNNYAEEHNISKRATSTVTLEDSGEYDTYPYMDTFQYYHPSSGTLSANQQYDDDWLHLQDTHGGSQTPGMWSEIHGESIPEDQAYYVDHIDDWVYDHEVGMTWNEKVVYIESNDVIQLDAGEHEGAWSLEEDAIEDFRGDWVTRDEVYHLDDGEYRGDYAIGDDVRELFNGNYALDEESVELTLGEHYMDYCLKEDAWVITSGDDKGNIIHYDDLDEFEDVEKMRYTEYY